MQKSSRETRVSVRFGTSGTNVTAVDGMSETIETDGAADAGIFETPGTVGTGVDRQ